jgi:hypothetical protein
VRRRIDSPTFIYLFLTSLASDKTHFPYKAMKIKITKNIYLFIVAQSVPLKVRPSSQHVAAADSEISTNDLVTVQNRAVSCL